MNIKLLGPKYDGLILFMLTADPFYVVCERSFHETIPILASLNTLILNS